MVNEASIRAVEGSRLGNEFVSPLNESYGYGRVPETILGLFKGKLNDKCLPADTVGANFKASDRVVLLMIDALGWCFIKEQLGSHPFLRRFAEQGVVSQITAQFPSTTAVHVTTMHSGLPLAEHAIPEFRFYEPKVKGIMNPFRFGLQQDDRPEGFRGVVDPKEIYPTRNLYNRLNENGIRSHIFLTSKEAGTTYNTILTEGASHQHVYDGLPAGIESLKSAITTEGQRGYFYFYYGAIDKACHKYGPKSPEAIAEVRSVLDSLETLYQSGALSLPGTATVLVADHGQVAVDTRQSIFIDVIYPEINQHLMTGQDGKLLPPGGSPRDMFVYTKPESTELVAGELQKRLQGKAVVAKTSDLMRQSVFGRELSPRLIERLPGIIVLPTGANTVWASSDVEEGKYKLGHHGGLSADEMVVPFMVMQH